MPVLMPKLFMQHGGEPEACPDVYVEDVTGSEEHYVLFSAQPELAEPIVRAVNCHDRLVASLRNVLIARYGEPLNPDEEPNLVTRESFEKALAILSEAKP